MQNEQGRLRHVDVDVTEKQVHLQPELLHDIDFVFLISLVVLSVGRRWLIVVIVLDVV